MKDASSRTGFPMACPTPESTEQYLEDAGFVDITRRKIRIPFHLNEKDEYEWKMSHHYKGATISDGPVDKNAFASLSMLHLTKELGFSEDEIKDMCRQLTPAVNKRFTPLYNNLYVVSLPLTHHLLNVVDMSGQLGNRSARQSIIRIVRILRSVCPTVQRSGKEAVLHALNEGVALEF